jgi:hypothetical protein
MENQTNDLFNAFVKAFVTALVASDEFKVAVKATVESMDQEANEFDFTSDAFKEAVNAIINEEDALIMFDNDKFKEAVDERIEKYDFEDIIKEVVAGMSFNVEVSY